MAYDINIGNDISVELSDSTILPKSNYDAFCIRYENGSIYTQQINDDRCIVAPGHNIIMVKGKNPYYGYISADIVAYINPICSQVFLYNGEHLYKDNELVLTYTGNPIEPDVQLKLSSENIFQDIPGWIYEFNDQNSMSRISVDEYKTYECEYENNINAGIASVYVNPVYSAGTSSNMIRFTISRYTLTKDNLSSMNPYIEYHGAETSVNQIIIKFNDKELKPDVDYSVPYYSGVSGFSPIEVGINGMGNFDGNITYDFSVYGDLSNAAIYSYPDSIMSSNVNQFYDGNEIRLYPYRVVLYDLDLISGEHYVTQYYEDYDYKYPGVKSAYISGIGPCKDTYKDFQWSIIGNISDVQFINQISSLVKYDGTEIKQISQLDFYGKRLSNDVDYEIRYAQYEDYFKTPGNKLIRYVGISANGYVGEKTCEYIIYTENTTLVKTVGSQTYNKFFQIEGELTRNKLEIYGETDSTIQDIIVGNSVTSFQNGIFANCIELTAANFSQCLPDIEIPEGCFDGCVKLQKVVFPK